MGGLKTPPGGVTPAKAALRNFVVVSRMEVTNNKIRVGKASSFLIGAGLGGRRPPRPAPIDH